MTDFERLIGLLVDHDVRFLLIGGVAATIHGSVRLTVDLDVVYSRDPDNLGRVVDALAAIEPYPRGAPPGLPFRWSVATLEHGLNFTLTTRAGDIDLLGDIPGGDYDQLIAHTIQVVVFGRRCRCLDLDALIEVKRAAGRPKDLEALGELEALRDLGHEPPVAEAPS